MFADIFKNLLTGLWSIAKLPIITISVLTAIIIILYISFFMYYKYIKKVKTIKADEIGERIKNENIIIKIIKAIKMAAYDRLTRDPNEFRPIGARIIVFCGRQGQGKTISCTRHLMLSQALYPKLKIATNYEYKYQNNNIEKWQDIIDLKNEKYGYIIAIDEAQNWFNARNYRDFDPSMLQEITTQRKQSKQILLTAQSFHFLDKNIRCQVQEIHQCYTLARAFTIVVVRQPEMTYDGNVEKLKFKRIYCYNHTAELRKSYDTYKIIETLRKEGFVDKSERYGTFKDNETNVTIETKENKKSK